MQVVRVAVVMLATAALLAAAGGGDRAAASHASAAVEPQCATRTRSSSTRAGGCSSRTALRGGSCSSTRKPDVGACTPRASTSRQASPPTSNALYVADFHAGLVRRVGAGKRVTTLARLPQVTAVAVSPSGAVYAVTMNGVLARISPSGRIARVPVRGGLDRPHGVVFDRAGAILVAEDSRRVRRIDPTTGRAELVVDGVDTNRIAVARDGTLFLAGGSPIGGSLRRLEPGGKPTILFDGPHVSDVAILPDGDLIVTAVEPGAIFRVDAADRSPEEARGLEREEPPRGGPSQTWALLSRRSRARRRAAAARRRPACSSRRRLSGTSPEAAPAAPA